MFKKGDIFPKKEDAIRIKLETDWEKMFHSEYIYVKLIDPIKQKYVNIDPLIPLPALISEINGDLLFGEFPKFDFGNEAITDEVKNWIKQYKTFASDWLEAATYTSAMGTNFIYLFRFGDRMFYDFIKSNKVIWEEDILGLTRVLIYEIIEVNNKKNYIDYKVQEHYYEWHDKEKNENGDLKYPSPLLDEGRKHIIENYEMRVDTVSSEEHKVKEIRELTKKATELNFIPIIKICNIKQQGQKTGKSDYQGKKQLFADVDDRFDQVNHILNEHADPWTLIPSGILDQNGNFNRSQGKMIEKAPAGSADNTVDVVTWDGNIESSFKAIDKFVEMIMLTSRISTPIAGLTDRAGGQAESGRALKWKSINTFSMIGRKREYWEEAFRQFFWMAERLDNALKGKNLSENMRTIWQDGLPLDRVEVVDNIVKEKSAGIKSTLSSIMDANEMTEDEAQSELERIQSERQKDADIQASKFRETV